VLHRDEHDKYPFTFGITKARLILDNIDEIEEFVIREEEAGERNVDN
jgi:hypothetical protein